jgi:undecaprenyl-phosphate 4-deoxy-4-formamido-L-arabinose transferase
LESIHRLSVVVPCCNEQANLQRFPTEVIAPLKALAPEFELVLVDDGSRDATRQRIETLMEEFPGLVRKVVHGSNRGLGAALTSGFAIARGDAILTLDADLTFSPAEVPNLLKAYSVGVDCVMGSPFRGKMQGVALHRRILSHGVNTIYKSLLNRPLTSVSSLFRLYRASVLKKLDLSCTSFDINAEILLGLIAHGANVVEVPATLGVRRDGVSKIRTAREIKNHLKMFARILTWKASLKSL